jgi:hypothetical protein
MKAKSERARPGRAAKALFSSDWKAAAAETGFHFRLSRSTPATICPSGALAA